jgi:formamidopyrimidine-DNA glycosylase
VPELPDVETFKRYADATALHQKIARSQVKARAMLKGVSASTLQRRLKGRTFQETRRHGKYLFLEFGRRGWLVLHFGMSGSLHYYRKREAAHPHDRLIIHFADGARLNYRSQRKLGEIGLTGDPDEFRQQHHLGPDALDPDLDFGSFYEALSDSGAAVKSALMKQQELAGIGNVYADEILFQAGVHPATRADRLDRSAWRRIYRAMRRRVLPAAIKGQADPQSFPRSFLTRRRGDPEARCPRCGGPVRTMRIGGRTAWYCPRCQRSGT